MLKESEAPIDGASRVRCLFGLNLIHESRTVTEQVPQLLSPLRSRQVHQQVSQWT
jgi:hypothetical protein